ncbi:MAG: non-ribosomal peptide synthetase [Spirochaetia bacterium]|nr:non-ribosomal peptide synthetase [Spirochaetia bacterium]
MIPFLQRLSEVSVKYPSRPAAVDRDGERSTTYSQLNDYSSRVASYLRALGLKKEDLIAIKLEKSMEYVAVQLGVMKCGCAFVPISDAMGQERIEHVLADSGAKFVFDAAHWDKAMDCHPLPEADWAESDEHDLAFIIYTSGSTGMPKGVVEEYGAYRFMAKGTAEEVLEPYTMQDDAIRFANVAPVTFSAFTIINVCMVCEAWTNYIVSGEVVRNPLLYMQFLKEHRIDAMFLTASLVKPLSDNESLSPKVIYLSSERVSDVYSSRFAVLNIYCNSELMSTACNFVIDKPYSNTPIGAHCSYTDMVLLDNDSVSEKEGEICLHLPFFRGYLNQKEENEKAFVVIDGKKFFRTRDFARRGEDGLLYVLGRADDMVKINGNRVEPAEVETALKKVLETKVVAVKAFENNGKYYLCAYYQKEDTVPVEEIRASLKTLLPDYMIPSYYVRFEKMPLNTNGKIDKKSLAPPAFEENHAEYVPPETETQKILCSAAEGILGDLYNVGKIGIDDDLILLGGDSICAMNLIAECKTLPLSVPLIIGKRTVRAIAEAVEALKAQNSHPGQKIHLTKAPLNDIQLIMLQDDIAFPVTTMFNLTYIITLQDNVDLGQFAKAVRKAVSAHPALLSVIEKEGNIYYLRYEPSFDKETPVETMSNDELAETLKHFIRPFLLDGSPLFRTRIIRTPGQNVFLFDAYHVIADGNSMEILMDDIARSLRGDSIGKDKIFQELQKEADFKSTGTYSQDNAYFKDRYDKDGWHTRPQPDYDTDKNILDTITGDFQFSKERVADLCRNYGLGKNEFYAAAAALAISMYNKVQNVMLSWVWNGREAAAEQRSVGVFYKDYPIAFTIGDKTKLKDLLMQAKEQALEGIAHGSLSYFDRPGLYQGHDVFCLLYQGDMYNCDKYTSFMKKAAESLETDEFPCACGNSPELEILDSRTEFGFILDYNAAEYKSESMEKFLGLFTNSCEMLLKVEENPDIAVGDIKNYE